MCSCFVLLHAKPPRNQTLLGDSSRHGERDTGHSLIVIALHGFFCIRLFSPYQSSDSPTGHGCHHCCYASSTRATKQVSWGVWFVTSPAVLSCRPVRSSLSPSPVVGCVGRHCQPWLAAFQQLGGPSDHAQFSLDPDDATVPARNHAKVACSCC